MEGGHIDISVDIFTEFADTTPSSVLIDLSGRLHFVYQNEAEVQRCVESCIKDALRALGLADLFEVRPDISVFSYRPDIVVVFHEKLGVILVVEVKKPGDVVFTSHSVAGQTYDYLVGNLGSGTSCPFAVLSCYDQMVIAHLDDDNRSRQILVTAAAELGEDIRDKVDELLSRDTTLGKTDGPQSPESKLNHVVSNKPDKPGTAGTGHDDEDGSEDDGVLGGHGDKGEAENDDQANGR